MEENSLSVHQVKSIILNNIRKLIKRHFFYLIYISKQKVYIMKNRAKQFNSDLSFGKWGEQTIYPWIEKYFTRGDINVSYWYDSDYEARNITDRTKKKDKLKEYDLKFGVYIGKKIFCERELRFEVKTDKFEDTGNLAFERKDKDKDSGAFSSSSEYFVYFMPRFKERNIYIIKTKVLRELLDNNYKNYFNYGGDLGKTLNFIIPKLVFDDKFIEAGGRIETYTDYIIPDRFSLKEFTIKEKVVYESKPNPNIRTIDAHINGYTDPFQWED